MESLKEKTAAEFARSIAPLLESDDPEIWLAGVALLEQREADARNAALREAAEVATRMQESKFTAGGWVHEAILALIKS